MARKKPQQRSVTVRMFSLLFPYKRLLVLSASAMIISAVFYVLYPLLFGWAVDSIQQDNKDMVVKYGLLVILIGVLGAITQGLADYWYGILGLNVELEMRDTLFNQIVDFDTVTFEERPPADLLSRILVASGPIQNFLSVQLSNMFGDALIVVFSTVTVFIIDPVLACVALWPIPIVVWVSYRYAKTQAPLVVDQQRAQADVAVHLSESINGSETTRKLGISEHRIRGFKTQLMNWFKADRRSAWGTARHIPIISDLPEVGTMSLLLVGGMYVINGELNLATLVTFLAFIALLYGPVQNLGGDLWSMISATGAAERVYEILDEHSKLVEPAEPKTFPEKGDLTINGVTLAVGTDRTILDAVVFDIMAGNNAVIVGQAGSGKSALLSLLQRLYDPLSGTLEIGGVPVKDVSRHHLRQTVKFVDDNHHIFDGTLRENLCYGAPDASEADIAHACEVVGITEWLPNLKHGLDEVLGSKGISLYEEARAQVDIARALVTKPRVLLLDGATDSMSAQGERLFAARVSTGYPTTSVIATGSRPGIFELGGEVIVIENGSVIERGAIDELIERSPRFRSFRESHSAERPGGRS